MYVQCPQCEAVFRVTSQQLTHADGLVRCGECHTVFDGMKHLSAIEPETRQEDPPTSEYPRLQTGHEPAAGEREPLTAVASLDDELATDDRHPTIMARAPTPIPQALADDLKTGPSKGTSSTLGWTAVSLVLIFTLVGQYAYVERDRLSTYPKLRPWLSGYCEILGCQLPPLRDLGRIELKSRDVYSHPNANDALMITASIVNNASFAQPLPLLGLRLGDLQGRTVALRRFTPNEYLPKGSDTSALMQPGVPVEITLVVVDPGSNALAFEFEFR